MRSTAFPIFCHGSRNALELFRKSARGEFHVQAHSRTIFGLQRHIQLAVVTVATTFLLLLPDDLSAQGQSVNSPEVPYSLPVVFPTSKNSPAENLEAPYTPLVIKLIRQLERHSPPTLSELVAASALSTQEGIYGHPQGSNPTCHNFANLNEKTPTTPRIIPLCFSNGLGLNVDSGPKVGNTTGLPSMLMLASSFDCKLANAMSQVEGRKTGSLWLTVC
jgi:hypothetical protein